MALFIQSLVNTQKAANGLAIVIFFLCQQLNTPFANNPPAEGVLYLISVFPPIVMMRMIKLMFIYQYRTDGLEFGDGGQSFDTYSVDGVIWMLATMTVVYSALGLYLDQIIQMEYGIAKPWNFLCVSSKSKN